MKSLKTWKIKPSDKAVYRSKQDKEKAIEKFNPTLSGKQNSQLKHWKSEESISFLPQNSVIHQEISSTKQKLHEETFNFPKDQQKHRMKKNDKIMSSAKNVNSRLLKQREGHLNDKTKKRISTNQDQFLRMKESCLQIEEELLCLKSKNEYLEGKVRDLEKQKSNLQQQLFQSKKAVLENKKSLKKRVEAFNQQSQQIKDLKRKIEFYEAQNKKQISDVATNTEDTFTELVQREAYLERENSKETASPSVSTNSSTISILKKQIEKLERSFKQKIKKITEEYEMKIKELQQSLIEKQKDILSLEEELNELYAEKEVQRNSHIEINTEKSILKQINMNYSLQSQLSQQNNVIKELKLALKKSEIETESLRSQLIVQYIRNPEDNSNKYQLIELQMKMNQIEDQLNIKNEQTENLKKIIKSQEEIISKGNFSKKVIIRK